MGTDRLVILLHAALHGKQLNTNLGGKSGVHTHLATLRQHSLTPSYHSSSPGSRGSPAKGRMFPQMNN